MRRVMAASVVAAGVLVAAGGYVAADVLDVAPGILTLDRAEPSPAPTVSGTPVPVLLPSAPAPSADGRDVLSAAPTDGPPPTAEGLAAALTRASRDPGLEGGLGVVVSDATTGEELWALDGDVPRVPASTAKLLSALAVADTLDLDARMTTSVVAAPGSRDLVLVARGDTLLAPGKGSATKVLGRAGLDDLAAQVADRLGRGAGPVRLRLDLSWAPGPRFPTTWKPADVLQPWGRPVVMTGLATQLGEDHRAVPRYPEREVAKAFVARLADHGVTASLLPESTWATPAPEGAVALGSVESATYAEVLDHTLDVSDNPLIENLVRQAAATAGAPTAPAGADAAFIRTRLEAHGIPTEGLVLKDASGLSPGQAAAPRTIAAVLALATTGEVPALRRLVAALPVSGLTGTLDDRFLSPSTKDVAGVPRAKTGTLDAGSGLAGTTVDADGRLLAYVVLVDRFPRTYDGIVRARTALDRIVAALTRCGCR